MVSPGLSSAQVDRHVGLRAGVRLHVGVLGAEQRLGARRSPAPRRRPRTRSRRSSACRDSPRRTCWSAPSRRPRAPRWLTKFSEAISSRPLFWRCRSWPMALGDLGVGLGERAPHRGVGRCSVGMICSTEARGSALTSALVSAAIWSRRRWWRPPSNAVLSHSVDDLVGEAGGDDPAAQREHVGVVVLARQPGRVEVVAERRADAGHLVGGDLLALAAPAEHDAAVGLAADDAPRHVGADRRVVDRRLAVGPEVVDIMAEPLQRRRRGAASTESRHGRPRSRCASENGQL